MLLILLTFICAKQAIGVYRTDKINETYDYLISRSIVTEKEKLFFENLDELIEQGENSDFANVIKNKFMKLFSERHYSSEPIDSVEMYIKDDSLILCIPYKDNRYNETIQFAYEFKLNGEFTKVATFVAYGHYYSIRNNRNDHIIKINGKDSIFNIRDEYVYE